MCCLISFLKFISTLGHYFERMKSVLVRSGPPAGHSGTQVRQLHAGLYKKEREKYNNNKETNVDKKESTPASLPYTAYLTAPVFLGDVKPRQSSKENSCEFFDHVKEVVALNLSAPPDETNVSQEDGGSEVATGFRSKPPRAEANVSTRGLPASHQRLFFVADRRGM